MDEELLTQKFESQAKILTSKYEKIFDEVAQSEHFTKTGRPFGIMDAYQLGLMLENYHQYESYVRENASASDLGALPNVAVDLIASTYAVSIAPLLASIQTIPEQQGIAYFKKVSTRDARADRAANDIEFDAKRGIVNGLDKYASEFINNEVLGSTVNATSHYDLTAAAVPIRSNIPITVVCAGVAGAEGVFINGVLMSAGGVWTGDINYTNGDINIDFVSNPGDAHQIKISYYQDFEKSTDIPTIESTLTSTDMMAEVLALKQTISTLKAFQFSQRFGKVAEDEALMDLAGSMADIESRKVIETMLMMANYVENTYGSPITFSMSTPSGQSEYEYRQGFRYRLAEADSAINYNSGRGAANRYVAGHKACEFLGSLPKFTAAATNIAVGPHVFGYLDGKPVIRTRYVDTNEILCSYLNPQSPFEASTIVATYMPVFITNTMQFGNNPLQNMRAIASWKAFKGVVGEFVKRIRLTA